MFMNKTGALSLSTLQWLVIRIPLLIASFIFLFAIISAYTSSQINTTALEIEIFKQRLLTNLYYTDEVSTHIGVIDPLTLSVAYEEQLLDLITGKDDKYIAARIDLYLGNDILTGYYSKHWYDRWKPIAEAGKGGEKVLAHEFTMPVAISDGNVFAVMLKKQFLEQIRDQTDKDVITAVEKEIKALLVAL